jgi:hypothetical protein
MTKRRERYEDEFCMTCVPDVFEVTPTTFSVEEKRAIGDFILFVGRNALEFLLAEIEASFGAWRVGGPAHDRLLLAPIFDKIDDVWTKYLGLEDLRRLRQEFPPNGDDPTAWISKALSELSECAMSQEFNRPNSVMHLLREYVELVRVAGGALRIAFSPASEQILTLFAFLAADENVCKINAFFDPNPSMTTVWDPAAVTRHRFSAWSRARGAPIHPRDRLMHNRTEWDEVHLVTNLCIHLPLREVICAAIGAMSQHYHPRRLARRSFDTAARESERRTLLRDLQDSVHDVWRTVFFHPIFTEFWLNVLQIHPPAVLHAEIETLMRENGDDELLTAHLSAFLDEYLG